jgi:HK97 family phage major capsid protein
MNIAEIESKHTELLAKYRKTLLDAGNVKLADGSEVPNLTTDQYTELRQMQDDLQSYGQKLNDAKDAATKAAGMSTAFLERKEAANPLSVAQAAQERKSFAQQVVALNLKEAKGRTFEIDADLLSMPEFKLNGGAEFKATMTTTANGYGPEVLRDGDVVLAAQRPPQLIDFLPSYTTTQNAIKYMVESTYTPASAAVAENSNAAEATFAYTETTDTIQKIASYIPITEEELEDVPSLEELIRSRLIFGLRQAIDTQVTVGSGTAPNIRGVYNTTSIGSVSIATQTTDRLRCILDAIYQVNIVGRASANLVVFHMADWVALAQTRDSQNRYLLGDPTAGMFSTLWGLRVANSEALTATNSLVLDTSYFPVAFRRGVTVEYSDNVASNFLAGVKVIKATARIGLKKRRATAACRVVP